MKAFAQLRSSSWLWALFALKFPTETLQAVGTGASMAEESFPITLGQAAFTWQHPCRRFTFNICFYFLILPNNKNKSHYKLE